MLKKISIRSQLLIAAILLSVLLITVGMSGLWGMSQTNDRVRAIYENQTVPAIQLGDLRVRILHMRTAIVTGIAYRNEVNGQHREIEQDVGEMRRIWGQYMATSLAPGERKLAEVFSGELSRCLEQGLNPEMELQRRRNWAAAEHFYWGNMRPLCKPVTDHVNALLKFQTDTAQAVYEESVAQYRTSSTLVLSLISAGIALAGLLGLLFVRSIGRGLRSATELAEKIAAGDLSGRIDVFSNNEIGKLLKAMQAMQDKLAHRTAQLVASNEELEEFSYSMSHDMRTPLRALDGFSKILLEEYDQRLDDEGKRLLTVVRDNAQRMGRLVDDILYFLSMGRRRVAYSSVDIASMASEVFRELQAASPARRMRLEFGALPPALGDRDMMRVALQSLLSNSIKFSKAGAEVLIEIGCTAKQDENVYSVRDHGIGFDMRYTDKLFKVFERVHPTGQYEGSGIGLALVKRIVAHHGGRVWAEGKVNEGTTIYFALPTTAADQALPGEGSENRGAATQLDRRGDGGSRIE